MVAPKKVPKFLLQMYLYDTHLRFKIYLRSDENMFINSQVGLLTSEKLANSAVPAGGLSQASGSAGGHLVNGRGLCHCGYRRPGVAK